jgi:ParB/RepB/Spo0J family partition protein
MSETAFIRIPLDQLVESPFNPRRTFNEATLQELATDIKEVGVQQPLLVRPRWSNPLREGIEPADKHEVVFGHRRYRASVLAGVPDAPCMVRAMTDAEARRVQISENLQREDVHPIEEAEGFQALMNDPEQPVTADKLAEQLGKSRSYVYGRLKLLQACKPVRDACLAGTIGSEVALLIARLRTDKLQEKALAAIKGRSYKLEDGGSTSFRSIRGLLNEKFTLELKGAIFDTADEALLPGAGSCTACPRRTGNAPEYDDIATARASSGSWSPDWLRHRGADVCTDPDCFDSKKKAHLKRKAANLEAKGKTVVDGARARAAIDDRGNVKGAYIALKDVKDAVAKARQAAQRDSKVVPPLVVTIQDPRTGKTVEAVKREELRAAGAKVAEPKGQRTDYEAERKKREEEHARLEVKAKTETALRLAVLERVRAAAATAQRSAFDLRLVAEAAYAGVKWKDRETLAAVYGFKSEGALEKHIGQMSVADLTLFMLDCGLVERVRVEAYSLHEKATALFAAAKHYGIDVEQVRAEVPGTTSTPSPAARAPGKATAGAKKAKAAPAKAKKGSLKLRDDDAPLEPELAEEEVNDDAGSAGERDPFTRDMLEEAGA